MRGESRIGDALLSARRPLLLSPALALGVLASRAIPAGASALGLLAAAGGLAALACALARRSPGPLLAAALALAGAAAAHAARSDPGGRLPELFRDPRRLYRVEGVLPATPFPARTGEVSFELLAEAIRWEGGRIAARGTLRVSCPGGVPRLLRGDRVEVLGRVRPLRPPSNPGEAVPISAFAARGILGYLEAGAGTVRRVGTPVAPSPLRALDRLRLALLENLRDRIAPRHHGLAANLLLGLRDSSDAAVLDLHARTGVLHYLAVSGVHAILVAGVVDAAARLARLSRRAAASLLLLSLFAYAGITGYGAPVVRACVLLGAIRGAALFRRIPDASVALALSAGLGAWIDPPAVLGASYQLSHAAALGIALFARPIEERLGGKDPSDGSVTPGPARRLGAWIVTSARKGAAISLAAWLCTTPISFHNFGSIPVWSAPATLALAPVVSLLMGAGYSATLLPGPVGSAAGAVFDATAGVEDRLLRLLDTLPGTPWVPLDVGTLAVAVGCASLLSWLVPIPRVPLRLLLRGGLLVPLLLHFRSPRPLPFRLAVLDVGHGTAVVCLPADGRALLFDAGSRDRRDPGGRILLPYLRSAGVRSVDEVVLSHSDMDHWNGLPALLDLRPPRLLLVRRGALPRGLRRKGGPRVIEIDGGWATLERSGARFTLVAPEVPDGASDNDRSLSLLVEVHGRCILLCGDSQEVGLLALRRAFPGLSPDLLLLPHHGLPCPGLEAFLAELEPGGVLVSAGKPARAPILLPDPRARVERTFEGGAIEVEIEPGGALRTRRFSGRRRASRRGPPSPCPGPSRRAAART
jgi:competence protein ComEC